MESNLFAVAGSATFPSIVEFIEGKQWLGLSYANPPIKLFPLQMATLKAFYRGSLGNENLTLTEEERLACVCAGLEEFIDKYDHGSIQMNELILVWGRRSGKDFVLAIIALYEFARLMLMGDPHGFYSVGNESPIMILMIGCSAAQAGIMRGEVVAKLNSSEFGERLLRERRLSVTQSEVRGTTGTGGEVKIRFVGSNSNSLLGMSVHTLITDEIASWKTGVDDYVMTTIAPTTASFARRVGEQTVYDGKWVAASSPRGCYGVLYNATRDDKHYPSRLVVQLATWEINLKYTRESLRNAFCNLDDEKFMMEFGAEFSVAKVPEETEQVTFRLSKSTIEKLKRKAREVAYKEDRDVTYTDLIREAIERQAA